jgi:uncharacterized membrane protein
VLAERGSSFQKAALVEFPRKGVWTIGFVASRARGEVAARLPSGEDLITIYVPTTPNPTGGYLLFVEPADAILLDMSVEDAAKLVISFGLVSAENADDALSRIGSGASAAVPYTGTPPSRQTEPV